MHAEVISIGDELTSGQRLDTNSQWLSERLGELGVRVLYHSTVGDDLAANVRVFREAFDRADLVISTGGLGPTADDLTREALAAAVDVPLVQNAEALAHIQALFARRARPMPDRNVVQSFFPQGSQMIPNPHGSAPGIDLLVPRANRDPSRIFALPGVPAEMREMWQATVASAITAMQGAARIIRHRRIKCFGVGESDLEQMLPDLIQRGRTPSVGITVSQATITLRITAEGQTAEEAITAMEPTAQVIYDCLGDLVYGEEDDELHHAIAGLLTSQGKTLSTMEWGTGGIIAHWLSCVDPGQTFYRGGTIIRSEADCATLPAPTDDDKRRCRKERGASPEYATGAAGSVELLARRMALAARASFASDYALAVGPFPANAPADEPGRVACAVATPEGVIEAAYPFTGHPDILLSRTAKSALNLLRRRLVTP